MKPKVNISRPAIAKENLLEVHLVSTEGQPYTRSLLGDKFAVGITSHGRRLIVTEPDEPSVFSVLSLARIEGVCTEAIQLKILANA